MLHWLTMRHYVLMQPDTMWWCGGVPRTKNYSPPNNNEEYYTTVPQCETLHSRMLCCITSFAASHVLRRLVFLFSIEYRISVEVRWCHSYSNCYVLITRMVSLLPPYCSTHYLLDHILLAVSALQRSHD